MREIEDGIKKAELIICDLTGNKPNVYYELGYAMSLGKKCLAITRDDLQNLPFDIKADRVYSYKNSDDLKGEIKKFLTYHYTNIIEAKKYSKS